MGLAERGHTVAGQVAASLGEIDDQVGRLATYVGDIASASEEQARGIEHLNRAVSTIDLVMQRNVASAEEAAQASSQIAVQAGELKQFVATFKLAATPSGPGPTSAPARSDRKLATPAAAHAPA
jgi:methyl-accepting chemotaxis protein-1 (serine sensor receptor)